MTKIREKSASLLLKIKSIPYLPKWIIFGMDLLIVAVSFTLSYLICFNLLGEEHILRTFMVKLLLCVFVSALSFIFFRTYTSLVRHTGFKDIIQVFYSLFVANLILLILNATINFRYPEFVFPTIGFLINFLLTFAFLILFRMVIRLFFDYLAMRDPRMKEKKKVLVYGTSNTDIGTAKLVNRSVELDHVVVGFVTNDKDIVGKKINKFPIYYIDDVFENPKRRRLYEALIINPRGLERDEKKQLAELANKYKKDILTPPIGQDWSAQSAKKEVKELKKLKIEDLLQRIPINIDIESIGKNLAGKTILVTGAAGSIGSEIVRQIGKFSVKQLLLCDVAESPLHELSMELKDKYKHINYKAVIGDVRNRDQMNCLFKTYQPDIIYHAAAYKHVPLMEDHPSEAILTNVLGSKNVIDMAVAYNAEAFVMISTDKAVNPSNVMGASKRIAEMYVQSYWQKLREQGKTSLRIITTRFGNVLGSNGSVIPRFTQQIEEGGPITVTHPEIIRYFMTIPEACRLVLDAGNFGQGGEVFLFDMGDPVKIKDMAEQMIRLSGLEPYKDIDIVYTGLRPGEKLYEELLYDKEKTKPTHNRKIKIGTVREYDYDKVAVQLDELVMVAHARNSEEVVRLMKQITPEFVSQNSVYAKFDDVKEKVSSKVNE